MSSGPQDCNRPSPYKCNNCRPPTQSPNPLIPSSGTLSRNIGIRHTNESPGRRQHSHFSVLAFTIEPEERCRSGQVTYTKKYHSLRSYVSVFCCAGVDSERIRSNGRCDYGQSTKGEDGGRETKADEAPCGLGEEAVGESHCTEI